jgi:O-antigen/teichoic acid export membrane protein
MLVSTIVVARVLGADSFGSFVLIQTTVATGVVLASSGFTQASTHFTAAWRHTRPDDASRLLGFTLGSTCVGAVVCGLILSSFPDWIASELLQDPSLSDSVKAASLWMMVAPMPGALASALAGLEAFGAIAACGTVVGVSTAVGMILGASRGGVTGSVQGAGAGILLSSIVAVFVLRTVTRANGIRPTLRGALAHRSLVVPFALPALLGGLMVNPVFWVVNLMLAGHAGGAAEVGVFGAARQYWAVVVFVPTIVARPLLPILSDCVSRGAMEEARSAIRTSVAFVLTVVGSMAAVGFILSEDLMSLFGPTFSGRGDVLRVTMIGAVVFSLTIALSQVLVSAQRMWTLFGLSTLWALLFVGVYAAIADLGALGCAVALSGGSAIQLLLVMAASRSTLKELEASAGG